MPANLSLELREEFRSGHMRGTAIELRNRQNTGWAQRDPSGLLSITYPTADVQHALAAISTKAQGRPLVFLGQRGRGKSHLMALLHHAFASPEKVSDWIRQWGQNPEFAGLKKLELPKGFLPISETMSNQEYRTLWDLIFDRHPKGAYYRGKFEGTGTSIPAKSLLEDLFAERPTALILDEFQTWFDGLHDESGDSGPKRRQWAFNFIQILSEIAKERPDRLMLIVSVRDTATEGYRQIHRIGPDVVDFKGETAREERKKLLLHRLFENRAQFSASAIAHVVKAYNDERIRLLFPEKTDSDKDRLRQEVIEAWPFSPELLALLDDHILMADSAQDKRDLIRLLAELFRARGHLVPTLTASDFLVDDDNCGVVTLIDSFATTADQERLREKAIRNLEALLATGTAVAHAREIVSGIWIRSLSATNVIGGTREELQLGITRDKPIDDNAFTVELATIVENSFNIHEVGTGEKRHCFKLEENPLAKVKATARNDKHFEPDGPTAQGLLPIMKDQAFIRQVMEHQFRSPDAASSPPSRAVILDPNWETSPWANIPAQDHPEQWNNPVLLILPVAPADVNLALGSWLARHISVRRNMIRFLIPKAGLANVYDDPDIRRIARCAYLAKAWKDAEPIYADIYRRFDKDLRREISDRFDRFAVLHRWNFQQPTQCAFHIEPCNVAADKVSAHMESAIQTGLFAPEDFETFIVAAAQRGETMKQVLAQLREPPAKPDQDAIPYLGDHLMYEQVLRVVARDKIAVNVDTHWYSAQPGESEEQALSHLKRTCFRSGRLLEDVQLGLPGQIGSSGVSVPQPAIAPLFTATTTPPMPPPASNLTASAAPITEDHFDEIIAQPAPPVIRQSNGAKSGINLLGDIERWGLPDQDRVDIATLTLRGLSVKQLRELCTRIPPALQAELQITSNPDDPQIPVGGRR